MDDLDELLSPRTPELSDPGRDALADATSRIVRLRRVRVIMRRTLAMAACYAAGIATFWWLQPREVEQPMQVVVQPPAEKHAPPQPVEPFRNDPPDRLERWAAQASGDRRVELYRKAGDRFLERGNEAAALRCYRHSLDSSRPDDLAIRATEDTWLLMSLKMARQREEPNVRN